MLFLGTVAKSVKFADHFDGALISCRMGDVSRWEAGSETLTGQSLRVREHARTRRRRVRDGGAGARHVVVATLTKAGGQ